MPVIPKFWKKLLSKAVGEFATSVAYMMSAVRDGLVIPTSNVATIDPGTIEVIEIYDVEIFIAAAARISRPLTSDAYVAGEEARVVKSAPWS